ncbi:MAG: integrin alpha, partial [bacterium]
MARAGDLNGDGFQDVLLGVPNAEDGVFTDAGVAYLHLGYADGDGDGVAVGGDSSTPQDCDDADPSVSAPSTRCPTPPRTSRVGSTPCPSTAPWPW